jgi:hypothetical protein
MATSRKSTPGGPEQLTFSWEARPVRRLVSQEKERAWTIRAATSQWSSFGSLIASSQDGSHGKTFRAYCQLIAGERLAPSLGRWGNSGMGSPTEFSTLNTSEFHSGAGACSLSDILETTAPPRRYYLSAIACRGILRRAAKRGTQLPEALKRALVLSAADQGEEPMGPPGDTFKHFP